MPRQLLVRELGDGREELEAVSVQDATVTTQLEDESGAYAPELGTVHLIGLADSLQRAGYRVRNLELRTSRYQPLPEHDAEDIEQHLLDVLRTAGRKAVLDELDSAMRSLLVVGFAVRTPQGTVTLKRNGAILNQEQLDVTGFLDALKASWAEVRGS